MIVSTILLSADDMYIDSEGNLPPMRPEFDKDLLRELVRGQALSQNGATMLPMSIVSVAKHITVSEPTIGITVPEIDGLTDLLIVVRTGMPLGHGKRFRFTNFKKIVKEGKLEIWRRI